MAIVIRPAEKTDIPAVGRIGNANWQEVYRGILPEECLAAQSAKTRAAYYRTYLGDEIEGLLIAECDGQVVGFAVYKPDEEMPDALYLDSLHIAKTARGKGIGTRLIKVVAECARRQEEKRMTIAVVCGNDAARKVYTDLGAKHHAYFVDSVFFRGADVRVEKLVWQSIEELR